MKEDVSHRRSCPPVNHSEAASVSNGWNYLVLEGRPVRYPVDTIGIRSTDARCDDIATRNYYVRSE
jgi:hypothetical protein